MNEPSTLTSKITEIRVTKKLFARTQ